MVPYSGFGQLLGACFTEDLAVSFVFFRDGFTGYFVRGVYGDLANVVLVCGDGEWSWNISGPGHVSCLHGIQHQKDYWKVGDVNPSLFPVNPWLGTQGWLCVCPGLIRKTCGLFFALLSAFEGQCKSAMLHSCFLSHLH
jgi:hypothetical protein